MDNFLQEETYFFYKLNPENDYVIYATSKQNAPY